jgi:uncharacterized membrane protein
MDENKPKSRCPWWIRIVLGVSLALNLAVFGLVAGIAMRGGPASVRAPDMGYALPYIVALPSETRRDLFRSLRRDNTLPNRRARRNDYEEMSRVMVADPFDRAMIENILHRQKDSAARVQAAAQARWLDLVAQMPLEDRKAYAARIEEVLERATRRAGERRKDR